MEKAKLTKSTRASVKVWAGTEPGGEGQTLKEVPGQAPGCRTAGPCPACVRGAGGHISHSGSKDELVTRAKGYFTEGGGRRDWRGGRGQDALHPQSEEPEARPAGHRELAGRG